MAFTGPEVVAVGCAILAALASAWTVVYQVRSHQREKEQDRLEDQNPALRKIEAEAYERARASMDAAIQRAQEEAARLEVRLRDVERRASAAEAAADAASRRAARAERKMAALRFELIKANIPIPAHLDGDDE